MKLFWNVLTVLTLVAGILACAWPFTWFIGSALDVGSLIIAAMLVVCIVMQVVALITFFKEEVWL